MSFQRLTSRSLFRAPVSPVRAVSGFIPACLFALVLFGGSAWSFEKTGAPALPERSSALSHNVSYVQTVPPSTVADLCLPLLKSSQHTPSRSAMDRTRRPAGQVAALSMALGVRFALGPLENPALAQTAETLHAPASTALSTQQNLRALKIAAYRTCQKEQALQAQAESRKEINGG